MWRAQDLRRQSFLVTSINMAVDQQMTTTNRLDSTLTNRGRTQGFLIPVTCRSHSPVQVAHYSQPPSSEELLLLLYLRSPLSSACRPFRVGGEGKGSSAAESRSPPQLTKETCPERRSVCVCASNLFLAHTEIRN